MDSKADWLERQQRMVKCPEHGLHFDPKMSTGCVRCLKERAKIRTRRAPQPLIILVCILGIAIVGYRIFGPRLTPQEDALEGLQVTDLAADRQLDPSEFRPAIEAFEQALFTTTVTSRSDLEGVRGRIASAADILRDAMLQRHGDSVAAREFDALATDLAGPELTFVELETSRDRWLRLRRRHLMAADWLHAPPSSVRSATAEKRASVAEYRDIAFELAGLLRDGSSEVSGFANQDDRAQRWRDLAEYLNDNLRQLAERKPSRPRSDADDRLLVAFQNLERAFSKARALGSASSPPADAAGFDEALRFAEDAAQGFSDAM